MLDSDECLVYNKESELIKIKISDISKIHNNKELLNIGESCILFNLGQYYYYSKDDHKKACEYFEASVKKGCVESIIRLGDLYEYKNKDIAKKYYLEALDKNKFNLYVILKLGDLFFRKEDCYRNEAIKYYNMILQNDTTKKTDYYNNAKLKLARIYIKYDNQDGIEYYEELIKNNITIAMIELGDYYYNKKNYEKSLKYYIKVIGLNSDESTFSEAAFKLGKYYETIIKNYEKAIFYYILCLNTENAFFKRTEILDSLKLIKSSLEIYLLFMNNNIVYDDEKTNEIITFENKLKYHSKIGDCFYCYEKNKKLILSNCRFMCNHYCCLNCYIKLLQMQTCLFCEYQ